MNDKQILETVKQVLELVEKAPKICKLKKQLQEIASGHLVIGVKDGSLEIVGTDLSKIGFDKTSVIHKMLEQ